MRKIKLYAAISLDGKIAKPDGDVAWLDAIPNPEKTDYGYADFYDSIETTLMGNKTYQLVDGMDIEFPYPDKTNYVFTTNSDLKDTPHVTFISRDILAFTRTLKQQKGKDIWLVGGAQINTFFFNYALIDEMELFVMPIIIGEGINLFEGSRPERQLKLTESNAYGNGVVRLKYEL